MKKLYSILFKNDDLGNRARDLYFRTNDNSAVTYFNDKIIIPETISVYFNTYFNSFSLDRWKKYTNLSSLFLVIEIEGSFTITIKNRYLSGEDIVERMISTINLEKTNRREFTFEIENINSYEGMIYFEISSNEGKTILHNAYYGTKTEKKEKEISIALVMCTFKREIYVERMLNKFEEERLDNSYKMFVIDNGKTLNYENKENVFFFKNKNYGGAGGFTRGIIEAQRFNEKHSKKISHILLMDDDILFDFRVLERLKSFLELKKDEYNNYFVAGSMCSLDHPEIQYESYASWRGRNFIAFKHNFNLFDEKAILMNEKEEKYSNGTAGWWFSCFSINMVNSNNYPFPCFFRGDDVEFTIRNNSNIINLNGLNVWHEPFYKKYSIVSENYYLLRNMLVVNSLYMKTGLKMDLKNITSKFVRSIMHLNYNSAKLVIRAVEDFLKGVEFFEKTNPEELNGELMKYNPKMGFIWDLLEEYKLDDIYESTSPANADKNVISKFFRLLTLNGLLLPKVFYKEFGIALNGFAGIPFNFYKTKRVFVYDKFSQKGYFVDVNKKEAFKLIFKFIGICGKYILHYKKINKNYQENFYKLQNIEFWEKYLEI